MPGVAASAVLPFQKNLQMGYSHSVVVGMEKNRQTLLELAMALSMLSMEKPVCLDLME